MSVGSIQVGTSPQQINTTDSASNVVTLLNNGPSTVYLSGNSSVASSVYNAYRLPPLTTMTWKKGRELWACTSDESVLIEPLASLTVNGDGDLSILNNQASECLLDKGVIPVGNAGNPTSVASYIVETAAYETLRVEVTQEGSVDASAGTGVVLVSWYAVGSADLSKPFLTAEYTVGWPNMSGSGTVIVTPVRGYFCAINIQNLHYTTGSVLTVKVYGDMKERQESIQRSYSWIPGTVASPLTGFAYARSFTVTNYNVALQTDANRIYISALGPALNITTYNRNTLSGAVYLAIWDPYSGSPVGVIAITSGIINGIFTSAIKAPIDRGCYILPLSGFTGLIDISGSWD